VIADTLQCPRAPIAKQGTRRVATSQSRQLQTASLSLLSSFSFPARAEHDNNSIPVPRSHRHADHAARKARGSRERERESGRFGALTLRSLTPTATRNVARRACTRGVTAANIKVIDAPIKRRAAARLRCPCDPGRFKSCPHNSERVHSRPASPNSPPRAPSRQVRGLSD